jgi:cytosine deaminase
VQRRDSALRHSAVIIGENKTFRGEEELLTRRGVILEVRQDPTCID